MQKGFFASLLDTTFTSLVTTRIIRVVYILALVGIGLTALVYVVAAFQVSSAFGVLTLLVLAPLASLLAIVYTRVLLEALIALFRIMENTAVMAEQAVPGASARAQSAAHQGPGSAPS